jgi:outer membrane protein assembly factor BamB
MPWGKKAALVAYEKATGNIVWTTPNLKGKNQEYESPIPMKFEGRDMILAAAQQSYLIGVDARTGEQLWEIAGFKSGGEIPSPTPIGDGRIFITAGYNQGCFMLRLALLTDEEKLKPENQGRQYSITKLWANKNMGSKCAQALLWNGYLYGNDDVSGALRCITLDGDVQWDSKQKFGMGNLILADGLIYQIHGDTGELVMAEAVPDGYKELARVPMLAPPEPWAPMAFKDGKLVIRDMHKILCLDVTAAGNGAGGH